MHPHLLPSFSKMLYFGEFRLAFFHLLQISLGLPSSHQHWHTLSKKKMNNSQLQDGSVRHTTSDEVR